MMPGFRITGKELIQLNNKKTGTPSKKRAKHLSSDFSKDKTSNKHMKIFLTSLAIRKMEIKTSMRDFPGGSVAKTLGSQQRGPGFHPGQETRSHMPQLSPVAAK